MSSSPEGFTALITIDVQQGIVDRMGFGAEYLKRVAKALGHAHATKLPVVHVSLAFRPGSPEVSSRNKMLYPFSKTGLVTLGTPGSLTHAELPRDETDVSVTRSRASAFKDSDLDAVLRARGITHLVLVGNATRMGVLATLFDAADRDYAVTVLSDCCADANASAHEFLMKEVFPMQAAVVTLDQWSIT